MRHYSLSQRIKLAYIISVFLLSGLSLLLIFAVSKQIEDYIFDKQLTHAIDQYLLSEANGKLFAFPSNLTIYNDIDDIPEKLVNNIDDKAEGSKELNLPGEFDYHYAVVEKTTGEKLYFILDVTEAELDENIEFTITQVVFLGFAFLIVLFVLVFHFIVKRALKPLFLLIEQIQQKQQDPERLINYPYPYDNEIGLLNETLQQYNRRIDAFVEREREFTSFASHELRTPVTVVKGALALLKVDPVVASTIAKPLQRVERATASMEDMIEMLLSLSREDHRLDSNPVFLREALDNVLSNISEQMNTKGVNIELTSVKDEAYRIEKLPAELVITNLLTNAIKHGDGTNISITLVDTEIIVSNGFSFRDESESPKNEQHIASYGLGLMIVRRICLQQGWKVKVGSDKETFQAVVCFSQKC